MNSHIDSNRNITEERPTFVTHLECGMEGDRYEADQVHELSKAGKPLVVRYDLDALAKSVSKEELARRPEGIWRYRQTRRVFGGGTGVFRRT